MELARQFGPDGPAVFRVGTAVGVGVVAAIVVGLTAGAKYAPPAGWIVTAIILAVTINLVVGLANYNN
jgi:hypothetical protein